MLTVIGEALIDLVPAGEPGGYRARPGGSPLNVAIGLARLGHRTALMARLADNAFGRLLREHAASEGIDLTCAPCGDRADHPGGRLPGQRRPGQLRLLPGRHRRLAVDRRADGRHPRGHHDPAPRLAGVLDSAGRRTHPRAGVRAAPAWQCTDQLRPEHPSRPARQAVPRSPADRAQRRRLPHRQGQPRRHRLALPRTRTGAGRRSLDRPRRAAGHHHRRTSRRARVRLRRRAGTSPGTRRAGRGHRRSRRRVHRGIARRAGEKRRTDSRSAPPGNASASGQRRRRRHPGLRTHLRTRRRRSADGAAPAAHLTKHTAVGGGSGIQGRVASAFPWMAGCGGGPGRREPRMAGGPRFTSGNAAGDARSARR